MSKPALMNPRTARPAQAAVQTPAASFWEQPLGYRHALLVGATTLGIGVLFHFQIGYRTRFSADLFAAFATVLTLGLLALGRLRRNDPVVHWVAGIPMAVVSTAMVSILALVGGVVPQSELQAHAGVPSIFGSWPFLTAAGLMQVNLILSAARRLTPWTRANVQYLLTHAGLALALFGAAYGNLGLERVRLIAGLGQPTNVAEREDGTQVQLPFQVTLRKFTMETFPPTLSLAAEDKTAKDGLKLVHGAHFAQVGMAEQIGSVEVRVDRYYPRAARLDGKWIEVPAMVTAGPAAHVVATVDGKSVDGWVSAGSLDTPSSIVELPGHRAIVMPDLRPKKFASDLEIRRNGVVEKRTIEVNKPVGFGRTSLYQISYDEQMGAASEYSVLEVVEDHGLPVVYLGLFALLAGVTMMMAQGAAAGGPSNGEDK